MKLKILNNYSNNLPKLNIKHKIVKDCHKIDKIENQIKSQSL